MKAEKMGIIFNRIASIFIALIMAGSVVLISPPCSAHDGGVKEISIIAPVLSAWTLTPEGTQPLQKTGQLQVSTYEAYHEDWRVTASDLDTMNTNGHMTEYVEGTYHNGTKLATAMQITGPNGTATLPTAGTVVSGSGNVSTEYTIGFDQTVQWSDPVSMNYRLVVTFTAEFIR